MFKMPQSAFIEAAVDGGEPGTETRDFGIDFFEVNSHERRSQGFLFALFVADGGPRLS